MARLPAIVLIGLAIGCFVLPSRAGDLIDYYREAIANDAPFAAARDSLLAGQEKYPQGLAGLLPQVSLTANESYNHLTLVEPPFPTASLNYVSRTFTLQLTQPLFRWANFQQFEQGKLSVALAEAQFVEAQQDLILRVAQAYFDVLNAQDTISYIDAQKGAISEQLASAKRNFEVGTATITDTNEAQSRFDLVLAQEIAAQSDLEIKRAALEQIIGKSPGGLAPLKKGIVLNSPQPAQVAPWVASSEQQNVMVAQSQASYEIAQRQVEVSRSGHYPTVDLVAERQYSRQPFTPIPPVEVGSMATNAIGVQVSIPIYAGGLVSSQVREAVALRDKAQNDLETARRKAAQAARQAYVGVTSGLAQVKALEAAQTSSQTALESNKVGYQVGIRINIDVLNAQQQLYSTARDLAKARYDTLIAGLRLKAAAGILTQDDLTTINGLLEH